ncbi:hypothetical protein B0I35DRAFT_200456 [Stachybotrys elegans]|uniref:Uncharacterized protein n=1 Tax=Stachybotrys elegans TaxID=80388 RepID=A0A8K0SSJ7_9HYPO|nr:hypothetical protein B0I35DRAFT_200456 [Stachybotrys elegans]
MEESCRWAKRLVAQGVGGEGPACDVVVGRQRGCDWTGVATETPLCWGFWRGPWRHNDDGKCERESSFRLQPLLQPEGLSVCPLWICPCSATTAWTLSLGLEQLQHVELMSMANMYAGKLGTGRSSWENRKSWNKMLNNTGLRWTVLCVEAVNSNEADDVTHARTPSLPHSPPALMCCYCCSLSHFALIATSAHGFKVMLRHGPDRRPPLLRGRAIMTTRIQAEPSFGMD